MDEPNEADKPDESVISEKLDQNVHIDSSISRVPTEQDLANKQDAQEVPAASQSTNDESFGTPEAEPTSLLALIEPEDSLIPPEASDNIIGNILDSTEDNNTESLIDNLEPSFKPSPPPPQAPPKPAIISTDNGIFEFMTPDEAIELYKKIHTSGPAELDWKFYGRKAPGHEEQDNVEEINNDKNETLGSEQTNNQTVNTEFDFDDDFGLELQTTINNESLQLKKRIEPSSDKKTNLSDIMSDIRKESHVNR